MWWPVERGYHHAGRQSAVSRRLLRLGTLQPVKAGCIRLSMLCNADADGAFCAGASCRIPRTMAWRAWRQRT